MSIKKIGPHIMLIMSRYVRIVLYYTVTLRYYLHVTAALGFFVHTCTCTYMQVSRFCFDNVVKHGSACVTFHTWHLHN